jgi:hypothetical protein
MDNENEIEAGGIAGKAGSAIPNEQASVDNKAAAADQVAARRAQFDVEQDARAKAFERDQNATQAKLARDEKDASDKAKAAEAVAANIAENDEAALNDGFITHDDLMRRKDILSQNHGALLPHEALVEGEALVKMAFPRTVILTHSAADVHRLSGDDIAGKADVNGNPVSPIAPGSRVLFWKGYHDVVASLADHSWLRDNGAYPVGKDGPEPKSDTPVQGRPVTAKPNADAGVS